MFNNTFHQGKANYNIAIRMAKNIINNINKR